jgi:formyltetrahydrofolate synthetase
MLRLTEAINLDKEIPEFKKYGVDVYIDGSKKNR